MTYFSDLTNEQIRSFRDELVAADDGTDMRYACERALTVGTSNKIRRARDIARAVVSAALTARAARPS